MENFACLTVNSAVAVKNAGRSIILQEHCSAFEYGKTTGTPFASYANKQIVLNIIKQNLFPVAIRKLTRVVFNANTIQTKKDSI
jgi:hypothetical protein